MRVKAIQKIYYDRRDRMPGDVYDMDDREMSEARTLAALGKIEILPSEPVKRQEPPPKPVVATSSAPDTPEQPKIESKIMTTETSGDLVGQSRRYYRRRDMKAKE